MCELEQKGTATERDLLFGFLVDGYVSSLVFSEIKGTILVLVDFCLTGADRDEHF